MDDKNILFNAYLNYLPICKNKLGSINQSRAISLRSGIIDTLTKCIYKVNSNASTESEKIKAINKIKNTYQQYCFGIKANSDFTNDLLIKKVYEALETVSKFESDKIALLRIRHIAGDKINLEAIFKEDSNLRMLINKTADKIVEEVLKNKDYTIIGEDIDAIYITARGTKYHKKNCPFCKGKTFILSTIKEVENLGFSPCRCINNNIAERNFPKAVEDVDKNLNVINQDSNKIKENYVTVFVDESVRKNLWKKFDSTQPETQGVYSYIICSGHLTHENQITYNNIIRNKVSIMENPNGTGIVTMTAISEILSKLLALGFKDNVIIYTDNMETKDTWFSKKENKNLAAYFSSVKVQYIPREQNTMADELGRKRIFIDMSEEFVKKILLKCNGYDNLKTMLLQNEIDYCKV